MSGAGNRSHRCRRRGASLYVAVMGVGMIVSLIALTTSLTGRLQLRSNQTAGQQVGASLAARSGIEYALNWMNRNNDWRSVLASGVDESEVQLPSGKFVWRVTDNDGDLADDSRDHAVLRVTGYDGNAKVSYYVLEVDIEPAGRSLTCLESAIHSNNNIQVEDNGSLLGTGIVSANDEINGKGNKATIDLDAEAVSRAKGGDYNAGVIEGVPAREMPGEHVFDWYVERGTEIGINDLDSVAFSVDKRISTTTMSRVLSKFGDPNPLGIYWIDCGGQNVRIRYTRSLGTLVLLNPGVATRVEDALLLQAEARNYPVLMVDGDLSIDLNLAFVGQSLPEGWGVNYNPPGIPYEGVEDTDDDDTYPARLDGIVYATGTITISDHADIHGNLIANDVVVNDDKVLRVEYRDYASNYPPPGFSAGQGVRVLPGTYRRVGR